MTRVNANLHPKSLLDQHLFAEYREIPMVFSSLRRSMNAKSMNALLRSIPSEFCLAGGHVTHFYDKLKFLERRRNRLLDELKIRGYNINHVPTPDLKEFPNELANDWDMNAKAEITIRARILERYDMQPDWYRYYGKPIERMAFIELMNQYNMGKQNETFYS